MAWLRTLATLARDPAPPGVAGLVRRSAVLASAVLVGLAAQPPVAGARDDRDVGGPCRVVERAPVRLEPADSGGAEAVFSLVGGALRGAIPLSEADAREVGAGRDVHVTVVKLGSYEPAGPGSPAVCTVDPTYHFSCEATNELDQLCIEWTRSNPPLVGEGRVGAR